MKKLLSVAILSCMVFAGARGAEDKQAVDADHLVIKPGALKWGPAPAGLPAGAQIAVLIGDPAKAGAPFAMRVKLPDGYKVAPHWHNTDENVTVMKGTLLIGKGDKLDAAHMDELPVGSFMRMPKLMRHFASAKGETVLQLHGIGPFDINYVNSADDPRKKSQ